MVTTFLSPKTENRKIYFAIGWKICGCIFLMLGNQWELQVCNQLSAEFLTIRILCNSIILPNMMSPKMIDDKKENCSLWKAKNILNVAYDQLKMWVDIKYKTPTKIECYTSSGMLIKTLYFKEIKDFGNGITRPAVLETDSPLHKGYKAVMVYANISPRKINDEVFTLNYMSKVKDLRK